MRHFIRPRKSKVARVENIDYEYRVRNVLVLRFVPERNNIRDVYYVFSNTV
jgi:hypothetical protein